MLIPNPDLRFLKFFWPKFAQKWILRLAQSLFLGKFRPRKSKLSIFLNIGTHGILEVLILNLELEFQNSDPKIYFWTNFNQNCCFWTYNQGFFKHLLLPLFGGKNSIFNWVLELNPPSWIISITQISLQLSSSIPNTLSTIKALQRRIYFQCFLLWKCVF